MQKKIKICFTSPSYSAYSETFIQNLKNGLEGEVFHCFGGFFPNDSEGGELKNYRKPKLVHRILRKLGFLKKPFDQIYLSQYLKKKKIDLIFANYGPSGSRILPVVKDTGIPLIVHFHGFDASVSEIINQHKEQYREMFAVAKSIIVVSEAMRQDLIKLGASEKKIKKITYSPNPNFYNIKPDYQSNQIIAIGRFVEKKAPYLTLMAFKFAKEKFPALKLIFVGEGPLLSVCRDLTESLQIEDVVFKGVLNQIEIQEEMAKSFCFIQHSKQAESGDKEGTPVAVLEAMASGLPIISTRHAGIPEVVLNGKNGFLVDEGDVKDMAEKICKLIQNRHLAEVFGTEGRSIIINNYNSLEYFQKINSLVLECINE